MIHDWKFNKESFLIGWMAAFTVFGTIVVLLRW